MKRVRATSTTTLLIAAALVAALSGCSLSVTLPTDEPSAPTSTSTPEPDSVESPTATAEPAALSIPGCDSLLTLDLAKSLQGPTTVFLGESPANEYTPWFEVPAVRTAITGLTEGQSCWWGIPNSDGSFYVLVTEIDPSTRASVESALTAEGYSTAVVGARTVRAKEGDDDFTYRGEVHQFSGDLWILSDGANLDISGVAADSAFDAIDAANPTLGL